MLLFSYLRKRLAAPALPYERACKPCDPAYAGAVCTLLLGFSVLEVLAFTLGGVLSVAAAYLWIALGLFSFGYLCWSYGATLFDDLKRGSLWGLLPLAVGIPLCFFNLDSFAMLNTESLSELQHALEEVQKPDLGYSGVFWVSYPSRSLLLNLIPTFFTGLSPWAYRVGFSFPILFGALFFFTGLRCYHRDNRFSSAVAALISTALFAYPTFCTIARTFEMAISSLSFGLWAIGALLIFASRPSAAKAVITAWTIGLLSASFTSGMALVALLWLMLAVWLVRAILRSESAVGKLVFGVLFNCIVVGISLRLVTSNALRSRQIPISDMLHNFQQALSMTVSIPNIVFTPEALVIPTIIAALFALSLQGGLLPALLTVWCLPVVWSSINFHGKIAPELPFALYRALIIIPAILLVMGRFLFWLTNLFPRRTTLIRLAFIIMALGICYSVKDTYRRELILTKDRAPLGREVIAEQVLKFIPTVGLSPYSSAWIVNRIDDKKIESFLPCLQYFLPTWKRIQASQPLPTTTSGPREPGIIVALSSDPISAQSFPGYSKQLHSLSATLDPFNTKDPFNTRDLTFIVLNPE